MTDKVPCGTSVTAAYYRDWMQKLCRRMHKNRPDWLRDGPLILHNNAHLHLGKVMTDLLSKYEWEVLSHAPYGPDMNPPDFRLISQVKRAHVWTPFPPWKRFLQQLPEPSTD